MNEQLIDLRKELNETKSQVVVAEYKRETEIQNQDRRAQEEISSLQHLVHGKLLKHLVFDTLGRTPIAV